MDKKTTVLTVVMCLLLSSCAPFLARFFTRRAGPLVARRIAAMAADRALEQAPEQATGGDELLVGPYRIIRDTKLLPEPRKHKEPIAWLREGTKVNVVKIEGKWLRIESFHPDKPPGYIHQEDAIASLQELGSREGGSFSY